MSTMRKMHTQNEVEQIMAPEIAKLYAAIEGKIYFDMQVEIGNGPYAIPANTFNNTEGSANIPCLAKLVQTSTKKPLGFALVTASGANYEIIYLFQGNIYKASGVAYDAAFTLGSGTDALLQVDDTPTEDSQKLVKSGGVFAACLFDNIKDSHGNNRFLEGTVTNSIPSSITTLYAKWSLSGSHLMVVFAGSVEAGTTISADTYIASAEGLPQWVRDKCVGIKSNVISFGTAEGIDSGWSVTTFSVRLEKESGKLIIKKSGNTTLSNATVFRISFDLLIDND